MVLEVPRHEAFQRREWAVQRVGAVLIAAFVVAGLLGLLGPGPLGTSTVSTPSGTVRVELQRVAHYEADDELRLVLGPDAIEDGEITVTMTGPWVQGVDRQGMTPQPADEMLVEDGVRMTFPAASGADRTVVTIAFRAQELWSLPGTVAVRGEETHFRQLVLP